MASELIGGPNEFNGDLFIVRGQSVQSTGHFPTLTATSCLLSSVLSFGRASATHFMELKNWENYGLSSRESI